MNRPFTWPKSRPFTFTHGELAGHVTEDGHVFHNGALIPMPEQRTALRNSLEAGRNEMLGVPESVRIYDNPRYLDRYTVVFLDYPVPRKKDLYEALGMNSEPYYGIGMHVEAAPGYHLGRRIYFSQLPKDCQKFVLNELEAFSRTAEISHAG